jgi:hypothetical protein
MENQKWSQTDRLVYNQHYKQLIVSKKFIRVWLFMKRNATSNSASHGDNKTIKMQLKKRFL